MQYVFAFQEMEGGAIGGRANVHTHVEMELKSTPELAPIHRPWDPEELVWEAAAEKKYVSMTALVKASLFVLIL